MHFSDHDIKQLDDDYLRGLPTESFRSLSGKLLGDEVRRRESGLGAPS